MLPAKAKLHPKSLARCSQAEARALVPYSEACRLEVLPLCLFPDESLSLLASRRLSPHDYQELRFLVGREVSIETVEAPLLKMAIPFAYDSEPALLEKTQLQAQKAVVPLPRLDLRSNEAIPQLLEQYIRFARAKEATDLHFEPVGEGVKVSLRIQGILQEQDSELPIDVYSQLCRRMKILAGIDPCRRDGPLDGSFSLAAELYTQFLRVAFIPTVYGERVALRLLGSSLLLSEELAALGMSPLQEKLFSQYLDTHQGVILLSGPTGSGKTTLLYAALKQLCGKGLNIVSIEDPVEHRMQGVSQIEVSTAADYPRFLRAVLRQDPDVLMLGELREPECAQTAIEAGITGHLVLSSIHAGSCLEVLIRLQELGLKSEVLAVALKLISSQRLVPLLCEDCREETEDDFETRSILGIARDVKLYKSSGCDSCSQTGVGRRLAVFEFLPITFELRALLCSAQRNDLRVLRECAFGSGYQPLLLSLKHLVENGKIALSTALRVMGIVSTPPTEHNSRDSLRKQLVSEL